MNKKNYSLYKTLDNGIFFEKPHIDAVTLKPIFKEKINAAGRSFDVEQARQFANDLLQACREVEEIGTRFDAYANNELELRNIVAEYEHQH